MFNKAIEHGKEHRKQYYDSRAVDTTCRNHGSCLWCEHNRLFSSNKRLAQMNQQYAEYLKGIAS